MMECDRYHNLLMQYFDHDLASRDRDALDKHIDSCPHCRALHRELAGILNTLENAAPVEPDADLERLVLDRIMSLPSRPRTDRDILTKVLYGSLAGMAALLFLILGLSFQGMGYLDFLLKAQDYTYWSSTLLVNLQIAYGIVSGLFQADVLEASREIVAASVLVVSMLLFLAVKTAFGRLGASEP